MIINKINNFFFTYPPICHMSHCNTSAFPAGSVFASGNNLPVFCAEKYFSKNKLLLKTKQAKKVQQSEEKKM